MFVVWRHIAVVLFVSFDAWLRALWLGGYAAARLGDLGEVEVGKVESGGHGHFAGFDIAAYGRTVERGQIGGRALKCSNLCEAA